MHRREFFKRTGLLTVATFINKLMPYSILSAHVNILEEFQHRVVWVHDNNATFWDGSGYYGDYVDQQRVNKMLEEGLKALTGEADYTNAWLRILPNYTQGKKIAIKININNKGRDNNIDALPQPVNAIIDGLKKIGVKESEIYVMEPSRQFVTRIGDLILKSYPNVLLWDTYWGGVYGHKVTYNSNDETLKVKHGIDSLGESALPDQIDDVSYIINIPIIKGHPGGAEITLGFKNNFGFFKDISRFHPYTYPSSGDYSYENNPLIDIYLNSHIREKTVLTVGDALFGHRISNTGVPEVWETFNGEYPNSLFLSIDPVAVDSVMWDFSNAEYPKAEDGQLYLHRAQEVGLGIHEHWNNADERRYTQIDFLKLDLSPTSSTEKTDNLPKSYRFEQNYPNPFNSRTTFNIELPTAQRVKLVVFDSQGRKVINAMDKYLNSGAHSLSINFNKLPSGTYFVSMLTNDYKKVLKVTLLK